MIAEKVLQKCCHYWLLLFSQVVVIVTTSSVSIRAAGPGRLQVVVYNRAQQHQALQRTVKGQFDDREPDGIRFEFYCWLFIFINPGNRKWFTSPQNLEEAPCYRQPEAVWYLASGVFFKLALLVAFLVQKDKKTCRWRKEKKLCLSFWSNTAN